MVGKGDRGMVGDVLVGGVEGRWVLSLSNPLFSFEIIITETDNEGNTGS